MPLQYWWIAFETAVYLINRMPTATPCNMSPCQKSFNNVPVYDGLKVFGCNCFPYIRSYNKHKFDFHTIKCVFVGYSLVHKGYKCLTPNGKIVITPSVQFNECEFPFAVNSLHSSFQHSSSTPSHQVHSTDTSTNTHFIFSFSVYPLSLVVFSSHWSFCNEHHS